MPHQPLTNNYCSSQAVSESSPAGLFQIRLFQLMTLCCLYRIRQSDSLSHTCWIIHLSYTVDCAGLSFRDTVTVDYLSFGYSGEKQMGVQFVGCCHWSEVAQRTLKFPKWKHQIGLGIYSIRYFSHLSGQVLTSV